MRTVLLAVLVLAVAVAAPAAAAAARTRATDHMYGDRYCEYLAVKGSAPHLLADVWNTYGLNDCPQAAWRASDAPAIATQLGALGVILNGPRYWLMERASIALAPGMGQVRRFPNGLRLRRVAQVQVPVTNGTPGSLPYTETVVHRRTAFTWSRRHPVYELLAPGGKTYIMQTYAQIVDPHLTRSGLRRLGARLELPAGWRFRTRRLHRDLTLRTTGRAIVVQDDLADTYQRER